MSYQPSPHFLNDRVILVTGAGDGIGAAVAKAYAHYGATVILLDKDIPALEKVYDEIEAAGDPTPALYPLDLKGATVDDYGVLVDSITDNFSRLDGLLHNAAQLGQLAPVQHQDPQEWLETLHTNLSAPFLLTRACLPLMLGTKSDHSAIMFTTDQYNNKAYWSSYGISKAGIETLSKQLADELEAENHIRVNCIDPGAVDTQLHTQAFPAIDPTELAKPAAVTHNYLYLMDPASHASHGQLLSNHTE